MVLFGWVSPDGKVYDMGGQTHEIWLSMHTNQPSVNTAIRRGWIRFGRTATGTGYVEGRSDRVEEEKFTIIAEWELAQRSTREVVLDLWNESCSLNSVHLSFNEFLSEDLRETRLSSHNMATTLFRRPVRRYWRQT